MSLNKTAAILLSVSLMTACSGSDSESGGADLDKKILGVWEGNCIAEEGSSFDGSLEFNEDGTGEALSNDYKLSEDCTGEVLGGDTADTYTYKIGSKITTDDGIGYELDFIYPASGGEPEEIIYEIVKIVSEESGLVMYLGLETASLDGYSEETRPDTFQDEPSYRLID